MKLNPAKCTFFKRRVIYCGHVVSEHGIETDAEKTKKVEEWPKLQNARDVREFLGFCSFYRRFVDGFARIAKPLRELTGGNGRKKDKRSKAPPWSWGSDQEAAFDTLRHKLTHPPVLAYPDPGKPYILHTDASRDGLGAVLSRTGRKGASDFICQPWNICI